VIGIEINQTGNQTMRGGQRKGAGRPRGAATRRTREIADKASQDGLTPLEVMLKAMREHADKKDWDAAASIAKDAAPYMHAKLASVQHTGANGGPVQIADITRLKGMTAEELKILERALVQIGLAEGDTSGTGEPED
jgi:hypothetical protein